MQARKLRILKIYAKRFFFLLPKMLFYFFKIDCIFFKFSEKKALLISHLRYGIRPCII